MDGRSGPKIFDPDFALAVLGEVDGEALAQSLQPGLEYAAAPPLNAGTPETARPKVLSACQQRMAARPPHHKAEGRQAAALMENTQ